MADQSPQRPSSRASGPALVPMGHHTGKPPVPLTRPVTVMGSRSTARIHLISSTVSKAHALLVKSNGGMYIRDLASRSHLYVNGEQVREADLTNGDIIKVGSFSFKFKADLNGSPGAEVTPAPPAQLDVTGGQFPIPVEERVVLIGRRSNCDVVLLEDSASTAHAVIFEMDGAHYVRDLGSRTGTFVNGVNTHQHKLSAGDVIRIGESDIRYEARAEHAARAPEAATESATGYALEAPQDELELAAADTAGAGAGAEQDTMGGLDLMGELVQEELSRDREDRPQREPKRKPPQRKSRKPARPKGDAGEIEPIPLEAIEQDLVESKSAPTPASSAEIEDLADELLADEPVAEQSSSGTRDADESETRVSADATAEPAPDAAEAELHPRRGWRSTLAGDEPVAEATGEPAEPDLVAHTPGHSASDAPDSVDESTEPALEASPAQQDQSKEVLRFPDSTSTIGPSDEPADAYEGAGAGAGAGASSAVLDQDALAADSREAAHDHEITDSSIDIAQGAGEPDRDAAPSLDVSLSESLASRADADEQPIEGISGAESVTVEPPELKLDFTDAVVEPPPLPDVPAPAGAPAPAAGEEPIDLSNLDLELTDEPVPPLDANVEASAAEPAPALDFKEPPSEPADKPLLDLDKLAPPPPLKLSDDAAALLGATQELTKKQRGRGGRKRKLKKGEEPAPEERRAEFEVPPLPPVEPFAFEDPTFELPPAEELPPPPVFKDESEVARDAESREPSVEVLDETHPTPESALPLDESEIADVLGGDESAQSAPAVDELSDTKFERAVQEFTSDSVGEIVESAPAEPASAGVSSSPVRPAPPAPPRPSARGDAFKVGANAENFLGGVPVPGTAPPRPKIKPKVVEVGANDPVDELIAEIDSAAAAAERARAETPAGPASDDEDDAARAAREISEQIAAAPFRTPEPSVRPGRGPRPERRGVELGILPTHIDEQIPPFSGRDATSGKITTGFDGLAMPPVRQADVFSQMSPPALEPPAAPTAPPPGSGLRGASEFAGARRRPPRAPGIGSGAMSVAAEKHFDDPGSGIAASKLSPEALAPGAADPATEPATDLASREQGDVATLESLAPAQRRRVRPAIPDAPPPGVPLPMSADRRPPVVYSGEDVEINPGAIRRKYVRRVPWLVGTMLVLIVASAAAVYTFVPVRNRVEASVRYDKLDKRTQRDREEIQGNQLRRLRNDYLREVARRKVLQTPEVSPGFLDDPVQYSRVVDRAYWSETGHVLKLPYEGRSKDADIIRLRSLALALYEDNREDLLKEARNARARVQELEQSIAASDKRLREVKDEIAVQRIAYERRPSGDQMKSLESQLARLEQEWTKAVAAVKNAEAELARLKQGGSGSGSGGSEPKFDDDELAKMQGELRQLQNRAQQARTASDEQAKQARERLDLALQGFEQEIASAQGVVGSNPELSSYIASAQKLQETTRDVIEAMVAQQEKQFNSLMELRARLNEKMEARRNEQWQADKELQKLTEELAILTRQYNAAVGAGYREEAEEKSAAVKLTQTMIKTRQDLIPVDPGYAEAIQQLELFIDSTKKNIEEDRKRTDQLLARLQQGFTSTPQLDKLPAEQKELARRLQEKLAAINDARRRYTQSLDAGVAAPGESELQQQIAALQSGIEARKKQLADQQRVGGANAQAQDLVKQKQDQIDGLRAEERKAESAYFAARKDLENAKLAVADARASSEKLEKLEAERNRLETELKTQNATLVERQRELDAAVEPQMPTENDIFVREGVDRRPTILMFSALGIFAVFSVLIGLTWRRALGDEPMPVAASGDLRPIQHPHPQPAGANGNGDGTAIGPSPAPGSGTNGSIDDSDEDHHPAII